MPLVVESVDEAARDVQPEFISRDEDSMLFTLASMSHRRYNEIWPMFLGYINSTKKKYDGSNIADMVKNVELFFRKEALATIARDLGIGSERFFNDAKIDTRKLNYSVRKEYIN